MNILVCCKVVRDYDQVLREDWDGWGTSGRDVSYARRMVNPFDEAALETALRIRDAVAASGGAASLTAVTVADSDALLGDLFAVGFDSVERLAPGSDAAFEPWGIAAALHRHVERKGGFDLVLCGKQAGPGDSGLTGLYLAERLGVPCLANVVDAGYDGGLVVRRRIDGGHLRLRVRPPLVLVIGNARYSYLRLPTLREKMAAKKKRVDVFPVDIAEPAFPPIRLEGFARQPSRRACVMVGGESAVEQVRAMAARLEALGGAP